MIRVGELILLVCLVGGWEEKWRLKLTSAKVEVEVEAKLGKKWKIPLFFFNPSLMLGGGGRGGRRCEEMEIKANLSQS